MTPAKRTGEALEPGEVVRKQLTVLIESIDFPRRPQQRRSREKYEKIRLAAARLFAEKGVESTTTKEIAAEAGVGIGTVYSYFKDKQQILLSLVAENASLVLGPAGVDLDFSGDPRTALHRALEETLPYDPEQSYLRQCWADLTADNESVAAIGEKIHESLYRSLLEAARNARGRRDFRGDIDVEATAWAVLSLFDSLWHLPNRPGRAGKAEFTRRRAAVAELAYHAFFQNSAVGAQGEQTCNHG